MMENMSHCRPTCTIPAVISTQLPRLYLFRFQAGQCDLREFVAARRQTRTAQHFTMRHCIVILQMNKVNHLCFSVGNATDMFKKPAAEDVLPKSKNHGLNPSDDPLWMIL